MTAERLSALDASSLAVERPDAPMHVGWLALFDPPARESKPSFRERHAHSMMLNPHGSDTTS